MPFLVPATALQLWRPLLRTRPIRKAPRDAVTLENGWPLSKAYQRALIDYVGASHHQLWFQSEFRFHRPTLPAPLYDSVGGLTRYYFLPRVAAFPESTRGNGGRIYPLLNEVISNRVGAVLGQGHVIVITTNAVRVPFYFKLQAGMRQDDPRELGQFFTSHGPE